MNLYLKNYICLPDVIIRGILGAISLGSPCPICGMCKQMLNNSNCFGL